MVCLQRGTAGDFGAGLCSACASSCKRDAPGDPPLAGKPAQGRGVDDPANEPRQRNEGGAGILMRVLVATDAWHPQVNGVVRTLMSLAESARGLGVAISFLTPEGFPSVALPTYRTLRCALPTRREIAQRIERARPNAVHIATEGPIGHAVRNYCLKHGLPFTTSYTTRFPE